MCRKIHRKKGYHRRDPQPTAYGGPTAPVCAVIKCSRVGIDGNCLVPNCLGHELRREPSEEPQSSLTHPRGDGETLITGEDGPS